MLLRRCIFRVGDGLGALDNGKPPDCGLDICCNEVFMREEVYKDALVYFVANLQGFRLISRI